MNPLEITAALLRASVAGGVAAIVAWLVTTACRNRIPASLRAWIWWLVAAHFLIALVPTHRVVLPSPTPTPGIASVAAPTRIAAEQTEVLTSRMTEQVAADTRIRLSQLFVPLALVAWLLGAALVALLHVRGFRRMERAWATAKAYRPTSDETSYLEAARAGGKEPEVRVAAEMDVPVTLAGSTPRILLPAEYATLAAESRRLVLAHECAHVSRGDLFLGWLPAIAETIFWFHPLARWASREYGQAREEACDARALASTESSPRAYGELLVHFGVAPRSLSTIASCGSPTKGALLRRLLMLDATKSSSRWGRWAGVVLIVVATLSLVPLRLQAKGEDKDDVESRTPAHLRIDRFAYLLVQPDGKNMGGSMRIGDGHDDPADAKKAQKKLGGGLIWWFRLDGGTYALDDPETIESVRVVYAKEDELQSRLLGSYDEGLETLAGRMELLHPKMERLDARTQELDEERKALEEARDEGKSQSELEAKLQKLEATRQDIARSYEPLTSEQEQISREMEVLSEGREKAFQKWEKQELEHRAELRRIAEDAVRRGVARKI
jgi:beta-lactamase regulating signal transducer with metallopeptidase domain